MKKTESETKKVVMTLLGIIIIPLYLPVLYFALREPKAKTSPLIPRLTTRGKIRFLEGQLRKANEAGQKRSWRYDIFSDGLIMPDYSDLDSKERRLLQQIIPLYESIGSREKEMEARGRLSELEVYK